VLLTSKFYNDVYFSNDRIASAGGMSLDELNMLELFQLETMDYCLYISTEDFMIYYQGLLLKFA
jgi:hypothetical protein